MPQIQEKDRRKWHSQPQGTWYFQVSTMSSCAYQGVDNVSLGVLGGRAPHQPSPRAVPGGHAQSGNLGCQIKFVTQSWVLRIWCPHPYCKELPLFFLIFLAQIPQHPSQLSQLSGPISNLQVISNGIEQMTCSKHYKPIKNTSGPPKIISIGISKFNQIHPFTITFKTDPQPVSPFKTYSTLTPLLPHDRAPHPHASTDQYLQQHPHITSNNHSHLTTHNLYNRR